MTGATGNLPWARSLTLAEVRASYTGSCERDLGMVLTGIGPNWLEGQIPAGPATQDMTVGLYHGAITILAETLGSIAANLCLDDKTYRAVGQILEVHHFEPVVRGPIIGRATPILLEGERHVWTVDITDQTGTRVSSATVTMAIIESPR